MSARDDLDKQRAARIAADTATARQLARGYGTAWQRIRRHLDQLLDEIEAARARGETVDAGWLAARAHLTAPFDRATLAELRVFVDLADREISAATLAAYQAGAIDAAQLVAASLPAGLAWTPPLPVAQTAEIAAALRPGAPLRSLLDQLPSAAALRARDTLIQGVALGKGTRTIGRDLQNAFAGNLARALVISRTEVIGAYRRAALTGYRQADAVVNAWVWVASLSNRTCAACVAMHGSVHPLDEDFASHPACRCSPAPVTRTWAELGFPGRRETGLQLEPGEDWFGRQDAVTQLAILGPGKQRAYREGRIRVADLAEPTLHPVWGPGLKERSLRDALAA